MSSTSLGGSKFEQSNRSIEDDPTASEREKRLKWKIDLRLCTIGGVLTSLNLIDSGIISSASVTSMLQDLGLDQGSRFSVSILIYTVASVCFQLPATIAVRLLGPRIFFTCTTIGFGLVTLVGSNPTMQRLWCSPPSSAQHSFTPGSKWSSCESYSAYSWYSALLSGWENRWRTNATVWNIPRTCVACFLLVQTRFDSLRSATPRSY